MIFFSLCQKIDSDLFPIDWTTNIWAKISNNERNKVFFPVTLIFSYVRNTMCCRVIISLLFVATWLSLCENNLGIVITFRSHRRQYFSLEFLVFIIFTTFFLDCCSSEPLWDAITFFLYRISTSKWVKCILSSSRFSAVALVILLDIPLGIKCLFKFSLKFEQQISPKKSSTDEGRIFIAKC